MMKHKFLRNLAILVPIYLLVSGCSDSSNDLGNADSSSNGALTAQATHDTGSKLEGHTLVPGSAKLLEEISTTPLILEGDKVVLDPNVTLNGGNSNYAEALEVANRALSYVKEGDLSLTRKVAVLEKDGNDIVIFDINLPENTLGGDYSYCVAMEKSSGRLIGIVVP